ncbi:creb-binding protein [Nannochloropsis gaditana]|uniref:histone acetyltransferase n=1 Tax=Nannochloropsis gaditana TaxID=72520 RepID=W7T8Y0_9STRA|nr:creb-binding protein [Nannochloropsis gaditana]
MAQGKKLWTGRGELTAHTHSHRPVPPPSFPQEQGIVHSITTLYDEHFLDPNNDATVLPYMEGDYWIGEVENLIKEIDDEEKEEAEEAASGGKGGRKGGREGGREG